jgi:peptidoglycan/xylan/chitin deacetylase (PgdA/CDA1 family)
MASLKTRARQAAGELLFRTGLRSHRGGGLAILMYHAVTPSPIPDPMQMSIPAPLFASHMACLRELDVDILPLAEGARRLDQGDRLSVSVVFDDGFVGVHDHALGALVTHRIPTTVFITTGWIGQPQFPGGDSSLGRPMTWRELATLVAEGGCTIGSHGHTHRVMTHLGSGDAVDELRRSRDLIAANAGYAPREFAYPFGSYGTFDARTRDALMAERFEIGCTTVWGRNRPMDNRFELRRLRMSWCDSPRELRKSLAGCYDWYRLVQRLQAPASRAITDSRSERTVSR